MNGASWASYQAAGACGDDDPDDPTSGMTYDEMLAERERLFAEYAAYLESMKTYQIKPGGEVLERDRTQPGMMGAVGRHFVAAWWLVDFDPTTLQATLVDAATRAERRTVTLKASQRTAAREAVEGRRLRWAVAEGRACYVERSSRNYVPVFVGPAPEEG